MNSIKGIVTGKTKVGVGGGRDKLEFSVQWVQLHSNNSETLQNTGLCSTPRRSGCANEGKKRANIL